MEGNGPILPPASRAREPRGGEARSEAAVVPLPSASWRSPDVARMVPSGRSVAVALILLVLAAGGYAAARETSLFSLQAVEVDGASAQDAARIRTALGALRGSSLVSLDVRDVERRLESLPFVASASADRGFPHTVRVAVRLERPVAVLRQGASAWLVSARGRVMARLERGARARLPRVWVPRTARVGLGDTLTGDPGRALAALVPVAGRRFATRVLAVRAGPDELTLVLRSGLELRLGNETDLRLKLAVGRRVAAIVGRSAAYADLTVPERPVVGGRAEKP